jgi:cytochrome P450
METRAALVPPGSLGSGRPRPRQPGGGVRRCAGAPFAEMEMREVLRAATGLTLRPARPEPEHARRSMLVLTPHRGGEVVVG